MRARWLVLIVAVCLAVPAAASTFVAMTPAELVAEADQVIRGTVVTLHSGWSEDGRMVVTDAQIAVDATLVGRAPRTVTVRTFGGEVGDFKVEADGFPRFEQGEHVLLFLKREPADGTLRVLGYQQGQFRVVTRLDGVTLAVPMVDDDIALLAPDGRPVAPLTSVRLDRFEGWVRTAARRLGREVPARGGE